MVEEAQTTIEPRMSQEEFIQLCQETLNTARTIEALLRGLNNGYDEALNALQNLKTELQGYINGFYENTAELEKRLESARAEIEEVMQQIEEIKPQMEAIYKLSQSTETSLARLEEINTNVTQIEQRIVEIANGLNLDELEAFAENLKQELNTAKDEKIEEIKNSLTEELELSIKTIQAKYENIMYLLNEESKKIDELLKFALSEIEKAKKEALDEIGQAGQSGRVKLLLEYDAVLLFSRVTLNKVKIDRERYDRIGVEFVFHTTSYPSGYVPLGAELTTKDYPILYKKSGVKAVDGKFTVGLPKDKTYIYAGKGV